jgi:chromosome partitioning protein
MAHKGTSCRVIVLGGSKGGCGRSTISRNMLVAARQAGLKAVGLDFDEQRTFRKWADRRAKQRESVPQIVDADVVSIKDESWAEIEHKIEGFEVAVVDTAPGVENNMARMVELCERADFVLVPTSPSTDDLESVVPWWRNLSETGMRGAFVLNKANRRTRSFASARSALLKYGTLAPIEIPQLEDIAAPFSAGLTSLDYDKAKGADVMLDLWRHLRREVGL